MAKKKRQPNRIKPGEQVNNWKERGEPAPAKGGGSFKRHYMAKLEQIAEGMEVTAVYDDCYFVEQVTEGEETTFKFTEKAPLVGRKTNSLEEIMLQYVKHAGSDKKIMVDFLNRIERWENRQEDNAALKAAGSLPAIPGTENFTDAQRRELRGFIAIMVKKKVAEINARIDI